MTSNEIKDTQLGMSHGKAANILRKRIMFHLLQKLGEDICFKCSTKIELIDELSIEHKIPWLYGDKNLFWDLDNIAFSHIKCNRPDRPFRAPKDFNNHLRVQGPQGFLWCSRHREFLPENQFSNEVRRWTGKKSYCKACKHDFYTNSDP